MRRFVVVNPLLSHFSVFTILRLLNLNLHCPWKSLCKKAIWYLQKKTIRVVLFSPPAFPCPLHHCLSSSEHHVALNNLVNMIVPEFRKSLLLLQESYMLLAKDYSYRATSVFHPPSLFRLLHTFPGPIHHCLVVFLYFPVWLSPFRALSRLLWPLRDSETWKRARIPEHIHPTFLPFHSPSAISLFFVGFWKSRLQKSFVPFYGFFYSSRVLELFNFFHLFFWTFQSLVAIKCFIGKRGKSSQSFSFPYWPFSILWIFFIVEVSGCFYSNLLFLSSISYAFPGPRTPPILHFRNSRYTFSRFCRRKLFILSFCSSESYATFRFMLPVFFSS